MAEPAVHRGRRLHGRLDAPNALGLLAALGLAVVAALAFGPERAPAPVTPLDDGFVPLAAAACALPPCRGLEDASGTVVPAQAYTRIASGNIVADRLLLELVEPQRIAAFSPYAHQLPDAHRYEGRPHLLALEDLEGLLAHKPDLFVVSGLASRAHVERLRRAGVAVFDLGPMEGLGTLRANVATLSRLLAVPERGDALRARVDHRVKALLGGRPNQRRGSALYVGIHGGKMYGGTVGSSLHDVLTLAGLEDAAAQSFTGWPAYTHEDLLALDPQIVLTQAGMKETLCRHPGLSGLGACAKPNRFVELPAPLLTDPGLSVLDAAEALAAALAVGEETAKRPAGPAAPPSRP